MTKLNHIDQTGKKLEDLKVSENLFDAKVSPALMAQAIRVYQDRQHQHTSKVKTRGEINLTTAKWFKQKGTGRARHGAKSAHIFVGGGVAHGPDGVRGGSLTLPVKMRRLSLIGALTDKAKNTQITIISGLDKVSAKTSDLSKFLAKMNLTSKVLLLTGDNYQDLQKAAKNLKGLTASNYLQANAYRVLHAKHLLLDEKALNGLESWLVKGKKAAKEVEEVKEVKEVKAAPKKAATKKTVTKAKTTTKKTK